MKGFLERSGQEALPLVLVDGEVALAGRYPKRSELTRWAGIKAPEAAPAQGACCSGPDSRCC
ncbi:MAG: arsenic metallochaperone ArsD family protein [Alicycliphilus denitrificans]|nr:arsenic metallochaperone ArsD family protein [Alicycliphilus denitrificans]